MASLNKVFLIGNITRDPELRYATSGTAVANFSVAINRFYTAANGEKKQDTCFTRVVTWGKQAEACSRYLNKGRPVFVEGRLSSRSWTSANGEKRSTMEVVADRVQFLERAPARNAVEPGKDMGISVSEEKGVIPAVEEQVKEDEVPF
jgi:single-strand DNA-binding protein